MFIRPLILSFTLDFQLLLMKRYNSTMPLSLTEERYVWNWLFGLHLFVNSNSVKKLIDTLNTVSRDLLTCLYYLLDILQVGTYGAGFTGFVYGLHILFYSHQPFGKSYPFKDQYIHTWNEVCQLVCFP